MTDTRQTTQSGQFFWMTACLWLLLAAPASAQLLNEETEDSDYPPGLSARYQAGDTEVERVDADIAFDWQAGRADSRLAAGPISVDWTGYFLMKAPGKYRFHAYLQGDLRIELDERTVLEASADSPRWVSGPELEISFGELPLEASYRQTGDQAVVKLFWSSDTFPLEPVSPHLLFREIGDPEQALLEQGRLAFRGFRCDACHAGDSGQTPLQAPDLTRVNGQLTADWIINKLTSPAGATDRMPELGLTAAEAADVARFLQQSSKDELSLKKQTVKKEDDDRKAGELLVRSTGCLVCHEIGELGESGLFGGGTLDGVGSKRSREWLAEWLKNPACLNPHHRMPQFQLSDTERRQVSVYLSGLSAEKLKQHNYDDASVERGRKLVAQHNCAACHNLPGNIEKPKPIAITKADSATSCLRSIENAESHRPYYSQAPAEALEAWIGQKQNHKGQLAAVELGRDLLIEKNCLDCHPRDRFRGAVELAGDLAKADKRLAGQSQGLIPPDLTAVGDRLQDEALAKAVSGQQPRRLPWLSVQMPRFNHSEQELAALTDYLIGHDRLPNGIPDERLKLNQPELPASEELLVGRELTGGRAFNCIACHKMGDYEPRNTALGTKGSDLLGVAGRLRPEYFLRWTMSPIRVVPGMEMPSFNRHKPGFPLESLNGQLSAIWRAVNDPTFTAPSNPTVVEQYWVTQPGEPARIVRDVFELKPSPTKDRTFIPRPLAVGFNNGHSVLFDLDAAAVRGWTFGDFAFQQTEGKSWYWYMAGAPLAGPWTQESDWSLRKTDDSNASPILPTKADSRRAHLISYREAGDGVRFEYQLPFNVQGEQAIVRVTETWTPLAAEGRVSGWRRDISAAGVPSGYTLELQHLANRVLLGEPRLQTASAAIALEAGKTQSLQLTSQNGKQVAQVDYLASVGQRSTQPFPEKPTPEDKPGALVGLPGFEGKRLALPKAIMPTGLAWNEQGDLLMTSLKGDVFFVRDTDGDGIPETTQRLASGLSAPFGITTEGDEVLVVHKPEVIALQPDGTRRIVADGWGHSDNYHDWVTGFARDASGRPFIATGSDYSQKGRPEEMSRYRGAVLELGSDRSVTPIANELRYPIGIAADPQGRIFTSDQQGVQNTFNEINHIQAGRSYGVPALHDDPRPETRAAIQIPHPWTRSVNGIFFLDDQVESGPLAPFVGHGVGCEYNNRFLVRFSFDEVNGELQGACYGLTESIENLTPDSNLLLGPMCGGVGPDGKIYVGSIYDSGWLGGQNVGEVVQLTPTQLPNGIREVRALKDGFEIELLEPLDESYLKDAKNYELSGYTRVWQGSYGTPDSGRYRPEVTSVEVAEAGRIVRLHVDELKPQFVYDLRLLNRDDLFPATAYYTMNQIPGQKSTAEE